MISRRHALLLLASAPLVGGQVARGQGRDATLIGFLAAYADEARRGPHLAAFHETLRAAGYVEGENLSVEYRWADGQYDRLPALAADLVEGGVSLIFATGGNDSALAARAATDSIPVVFVMGNDPVELGLIESLGRPGGNMTGVSIFASDLDPKRLGLLHELMPTVMTVDVLYNPTLSSYAENPIPLEEAAEKLGVQLRLFAVTSDREVGAAFAGMAALGSKALFVAPSLTFVIPGEHIVALAAQHRIATIYYNSPALVREGGLISYGIDLPDAYRQAAGYVARILNGERPGDLPVLQPTTFELAINLKAAANLGITVPLSLLTAATEIIE